MNATTVNYIHLHFQMSITRCDCSQREWRFARNAFKCTEGGNLIAKLNAA